MEYGIISSMEPHRCLECGNVIPHMRTGKIFCCDSCRNRYHNAEKRQLRVYRRRIGNRLDRNYTILEGLLAQGVDSLPLSDLQLMGFSPETVTGYFLKQRRSLELGCYDILYKQSGTKVFDLHRVRSPAKDSPHPYVRDDAALPP